MWVTAERDSPDVLEATAKLVVMVRSGRSWAGPADPSGGELTPEGRSQGFQRGRMGGRTGRSRSWCLECREPAGAATEETGLGGP